MWVARRRRRKGTLKPYQKVEENALAESLVHIERKTFHLSLKENIRGRLLRITEEAGHIHGCR